MSGAENTETSKKESETGQTLLRDAMLENVTEKKWLSSREQQRISPEKSLDYGRDAEYTPPDVSALKLKHMGEPIFILGGGPSMKNIDLSVLDDYLTIGCSQILRIYQPSYVVFNDFVMKDIIKGLDEEYKGPLITFGFETDDERFTYILPDMHGGYFLGNSPNHTSAHTAVKLARWMGCTTIVLVGIDYKVKDEDVNFYEHYKGSSAGEQEAYKEHLLTMKMQFQLTIPTWAHFFFEMIEDNYRVINVNLDSAVPYFPKVTLERVLLDLNTYGYVLGR